MTIEDLRASIKESTEESVNKWFNKWAKTYEQQLHRILDRSAEKLVLSMLGLEGTLDGRWRIDHCNGRAGESVVGRWLKERCTQAVGNWLLKFQEQLPPPPQDAIDAVREEYAREFRWKLKDAIKSRANSAAQQHAQDLADRYFAEMDIALPDEIKLVDAQERLDSEN